jgi:hypothetical protein
MASDSSKNTSATTSVKAATTPNELASALAELDFNVSDEEVSQALKLWSVEHSASEYLRVKSIDSEMLDNFSFLKEHI